MIDIHCHLLSEVDDGADNIEQSLNGLALASEAGFTDVILTPHYIEGYYDNSIENVKEKIEELKSQLLRNNIFINVHQGNEIYIADNMCDLLLEGVPSTLASSKYVLFELPLNNKVFNVLNIIKELKQKGFIPIMAHPERYSYIQDNPNEVMEYIRAGAYMQCNYGSVIGSYGKEAKTTIKKLLEHNMVHLLASDTHKRGFVYENMPFILKELNKIINEQTIKRLTITNPKCIIQDEEFQIQLPIQIKEKKGFFSRFGI